MTINKLAVKNYYYLAAGILSILFSFTHAWNGKTTILPIVNASNIDLATKTIVFYVWHIITAENFGFGVSFLIMAFYKDLAKVKFTAWLIVIMIIGRWVVVFGSILFKNSNSLADTLSDLIAIIIYVGLIILGTRVKDKL
ncbi:hypothetical protein [Chamaesiphon sp. VAR_48_metabat_403]|uniref:hypothetical protein n=1 Tax=Chamaesiphon sp. VAR_48_metabat_403 TaxID=2964700 RepID=UPI00286E43FF|nr:hypothetical protein [Chamaesiphon sp. VAR_48_metabat_403]